MTTGFKNNNPGNINYVPGYDPPGYTGQFTLTRDGQKNMIFSSMTYGIAAMMKILYKDWKQKNLQTIYGIVKNYVGSGGDSVYLPYAKQVLSRLRTYGFDLATINTNFVIGNNYENAFILALAKSMAPEEITEFNQITNIQWQQGLSEFLNQTGQAQNSTVISWSETDNKIGIWGFLFAISFTFWYLAR